MASPAPKTQHWSARENEHKPSGVHILVGGQVEVDYDKAPLLKETKGDGTVLALDLTLVEDAACDPVKDKDGNVLTMPPVWKAASFHKVVDPNQFASVAIRWANETMTRVPVLDDDECAALVDKETKAQNRIVPKAEKVKKVAAKKPAVAKPAATKPAAAKKAAKPAAKKVAKKAVKKAAKKAAKKVVRKVAKKAVKKSGFKKLVRKVVKALTPAKKKKSKKR
jgi:hypothetical protein